MVNRDGANTSLWQTTADRGTKNGLPAGKTFDVIIAGGGIAGVSIAWLLQRAGFSCVILEAESLCYGTTGGTTAHINTLLDTPYSMIKSKFGKEEAALVYRCVDKALALIGDNIYVNNIDCGFRAQEAFLYAVDEKQEKELENIMQASAEAGAEVEFTDSIPVPVSFKRAMRARRQAAFHPLRYVFALADAFEAAGGVIVEHCRVVHSEEKDSVEVDTTQGTFTGRYLIYATHTPPGVHFLHTMLIPYRSYAMAVRLSDQRYPENLSYDMYDPYHYYRTQVIDGQPYLIAGGKDHRTGEVEHTSSCFRQLEAELRKHFSIADVAYRWSSQYYEPVDGLPYIGFLPGSHKVLTATGFGGNGMIYSSVAAMLLKDLLLQTPGAATELFSPSRLKVAAGFSSFVKHNVSTLKELLGKLFPAEAMEEVVMMAPGEARVVTYQEQKIGLFKDLEGKLHAVRPACMHMQCDVRWNETERSWDCPCHGARYSPDGKVLNAPSTEGLSYVFLSDIISGGQP